MNGPILIYLKDMLHGIASGLLIPTIIILICFLALSVVELGGLLVEIIMERRREKTNVPQLISALPGKGAVEIMAKIEQSSLFLRQKEVIAEIIRHRELPSASLRALARRLLSAEESHFTSITDRTDLVARLAPMLGLMGTLIPLGPGIIALGQGDTQTLASSLLIAFDTTVAGLAAAGVAYGISRLRKRWYEEQINTLAALLESLLEVFENGRGLAE
ncbi:MAG: MotA/TolQ/ExbB proton channel family protein [Firmicutes bacterium]|nr:MotA/TolQ/ExbB proton channel family protein [Bacillota bacterium]